MKIGGHGVRAATARRWQLLHGVTACCVAAFGQPAQAQSTDAVEADETPEIIVTASRRAVDLQSLPQSVTALTADRIAEVGARAKDDLVYFSPGVSFTDSGAGRQQFTIRGIEAVSGEATTAVYVDETPVFRGAEAQFDIRLFDVDRVEVLRGPQGTLYGSSAMGGAIRIITTKPDATAFSGKFEGGVSTTKEGSEGFDLNAAINIPIVADKLAVRAVAFRQRESGFVDNFQLSINDDGSLAIGGLTDRNVGQRDITGLRLAARLTPSEDFSATATYYLQDSEFRGVSGEEIDPENGLLEGQLRQARSFIERPSNLSQQVNFTLEYTADSAAIVSSTSYAWARDTANEDFTRRFGPVFGSQSMDVFQIADGWEFTQELRAYSTGTGPFGWLVGAYYTDSENQALQELRVLDADPFVSLFVFQARNPSSEYSFFGELSYYLTPKLQITGGLRRYDVTRKFRDVTLAGPLVGPDDILDVGEASKSGVTYKGVVSYTPTDDHLVFFSISSGYRPGGPNGSIPSETGPFFPPPFEPDTVQQFEAGLKSAWFDDRLIFNAALYYIKWDNIQVSIRDRDFSYTGNVGKAHTQGLEVELLARPLDGLSLNSNFSVQEAEQDVDDEVLGTLKGDRLPNVPKFTGSVGASYEFEISPGVGAYANGSYSWVGSRIASLVRGGTVTQVVRLEAYDLVQLSAGVRFGRFDIGAYVSNLLDDRGQLGRRGSTIDAVQYTQPRTIGLIAKTQF